MYVSVVRRLWINNRIANKSNDAEIFDRKAR